VSEIFYISSATMALVPIPEFLRSNHTFPKNKRRYMVFRLFMISHFLSLRIPRDIPDPSRHRQAYRHNEWTVVHISRLSLGEGKPFPSFGWICDGFLDEFHFATTQVRSDRTRYKPTFVRKLKRFGQTDQVNHGSMKISTPNWTPDGTPGPVK
jgi:hypothetical protein